MNYLEQYGIYKELCETGHQLIYTKDINKDNINIHFNSILNILKDAIETDEVQHMMISILFVDNINIELSIFDYLMNLAFWQLPAYVNAPIYSIHLFFPENITRGEIKEYIDNIFVDKYRSILPFITMNQIIDSVIGKFRDLEPFQMYLSNSLNIEDTIELMNQYPEFNNTVHFDTTGIPLEDVKDKGLEAANIQIKYIKNSDHCLRDSFRTGEAINAKQYKEVAVNVGTKPDGNGGIFPHPIEHSFMNGGLISPEELCIESSVGRVAQILSKTNVGKSGEFARKLELNNSDTRLNPDPEYTCDTQNFEEIVIDSKTKLKMYDLRYYRDNPLGVDKLLEAKRDQNLIGRKLYFRSPMTCNSASHGQGICRKCYGNLYYSNREVNVGQIAAEGLSSIYTQILLSAKHLLESLVVKMKWNPEFYELFKVTFNSISLNDTKTFRNWKLIIDEDIKAEDDMDETTYNYYINSFLVVTDTGKEIRIHTEESDNIYFLPEFYDYINNPKNNGVNINDDIIEIDMVSLLSFDVLFILEMRNNELSRTMNSIKKLIDSKNVIAEHDRNSILDAFVTTNIAGKITINAVHFEVLLMNQIRAMNDDLESPDWSVPDQQYQIFALSKALKNNKSIAVRLQYSDIAKALLDPNNDNICKPSMSDLYFMKKPQEYLDPSYISENNIESDKDVNIEEPIIFKNKNVKCGRSSKKRKIIKEDEDESN